MRKLSKSSFNTLVSMQLFALKIFACLSFSLFSIGSLAQNSRAEFNATVVSSFKTEAFTIKAGERFVSNALSIKNNKKETIKFTVEIVFPSSWKKIGVANNTYELNAGDSIIIPIRIIPTNNTKDGSTVNIQALIVDQDLMLLSDASFKVVRKKEVKWKLDSDNGDKIYFPTQDSTVPFNIRVLNEGNEKIDLLVSKKQLGNKIKINEVIEDPQHRDYNELQLDPSADTSLNFMATINDRYNATSKIDIENYNPGALNEETRNTLFFQSSLSNNADTKNFSGSKRLDFIRLSDESMVNPYGSATIPLIADINTYNILGIQPVTRVDLKGSTMLSNQAVVSYQTQTNFTSYQYDNTFTNNLFYRLSYSTAKGEVQIGNISGGINMIPITGRGISSSYFIKPNLRAGAFYVKSNFSSTDNSSAFGGFVRYQHNKLFTTTLQAGKTLLPNNGENVYANISNSIHFLRTQQISIAYSISKNISPLTNETKSGNSISGSYSGTYFKHKLYSAVRGTMFSKNYGANGLPAYNLSHRSGFNGGKTWSIILQNTLNIYQQRIYSDTILDTISNYANYNQLFFNFNRKNARFMPSIFYNETELNKLKVVYRGMGMDYSINSDQSNSRFAISLRGGYNKLPQYTYINDYFTMQVSASAQRNTFSFNGRYNYGPQYVTDPSQIYGIFKYPQSIFLSVNKQIIPNNRRFVVQTSGNYSYMNQFNRHTAGIYPEAYYFTSTKWRFKLGLGYSMSFSKTDKSIQAYQGENAANFQEKKVTTQSFFMNCGVRKEFGIPVPKSWSKKSFRTITFTAFLDANGNKVKDKNEVILKNIVVKVGNYEVISNESGECKLLNIGAGIYPIKVWSLFELNGWYPLVDDSLMVGPKDEIMLPFVKGIKLSGSIVLQKDRFSGLQATADLSRILVTATDSTGKVYQSITDKNGDYILYLPPGDFSLSMDESILGKSFVVLKNNSELSLMGVESYNFNFYIIEKKRKVNIKKFGEPTEEKK